MQRKAAFDARLKHFLLYHKTQDMSNNRYSSVLGFGMKSPGR